MVRKVTRLSLVALMVLSAAVAVLLALASVGYMLAAPFCATVPDYHAAVAAGAIGLCLSLPPAMFAGMLAEFLV